MTGRPLGFVKKPIRCPEWPCDVITAVPFEGQMWLTADAAGFYPHGYRCRAHKTRQPDVVPQPADAPPRLREQKTVSPVAWEDAS